MANTLATTLATPVGAWLPGAWLLIYSLGLLWTLLSRLHDRRLLAKLLATSAPLSSREVSEHGGIDASQAAALARYGIAVRETPVAVSPMLLGLLKPSLLLPAHLRGFAPEQQRLIVEHELTHWRRRDPLWLATALLLQALLWFNPVLRRLAMRLSWAQELACDRQVLAGRTQRQRQLYAAALLRQLAAQLTPQRHASATPADLRQAVLAFGGIDGAAMAQRIRLMRETAPLRTSRAGKVITALAPGATAAACLLLQPALAWHLPDAAPLRTATAITMTESGTVSDKPAEPAWRYPLEHVRVSSFYGVVSRLLPDGHHGIDLIAARGTSVHASAAGLVGTGYDGRHGNFVTIDHGPHLRSLYAHLERIDVSAGQAVAAGQVVGKVGATGMATGPHLHFELYRDGRLADPQTMLAGLDQRATAHALVVRQAQMGR